MSDQTFDRRSHEAAQRLGLQVKGERRVITTVFCDVTSSTSIFEQARDHGRQAGKFIMEHIVDQDLGRRFLNLHEVHLLMENGGNNLA